MINYLAKNHLDSSLNIYTQLFFKCFSFQEKNGCLSGNKIELLHLLISAFKFIFWKRAKVMQ